MSFRIIAVLVALSLVGACKTKKHQIKEGVEYATAPSPVAAARLQARIDNIKYQRGVTLIANLERIAGQGELAINACIEGLESPDAMTRMGCAYALGRIGDTRTVPDLEQVLQDEVPFVRFEAASALGGMGSRSGYAVLVGGLDNGRVEFRYKCIEALQGFTNHTFGYRHDASPEERGQAIDRWREWLDRLEAEEL